MTERRSATHHDEMVSGVIRPQWQAAIGALRALPDDAIAERAERAGRQHADMAIAYTVEGEWRIPERERGFDIVPMVIPAEEWNAIVPGLQQRAAAIGRVLADLHGERRLVAEGRLPAALLFGNPHFRRCCVGIDGRRAPHVHVYAADLVRLADGDWRVLADHLQVPAGIGLALQNRSILARTVPELFRAQRVRRLEPFVELWQAGLASLSPKPGQAPRIVVLTPGPFSRAFFEHVYLARQLGAAVVEGGDLTVRDSRAYIKTLAGLAPVDVVLRCLDDDFCDPLELRGDSVLGVPGLLQAVRSGTVVVANAIGAGLGETAAIRHFLPSMAEHLLGEPLLLPSVETRWLGEVGAIEALRDWDAPFALRSAFAGLRDPALLERAAGAPLGRLPDEVRRRPDLYIAERQVDRSVIPVWTTDGLQPRPMTLRVFLVHDGSEFRALPGGFTQASVEGGTVSKDTWVQADEGAGLRPSARRATRPSPQPRAEELRSRTADNLFWLGRYMERLDNIARLVRSTASRLGVERSLLGHRIELQHLIRLLARSMVVPARAVEILPDVTGLLGSLAAGCDGDSTFTSSFRAVNGIALALRDRLSNDMWKIVLGSLRDARREVEAASHSREADRLIAAMDSVIATIAAFGGMASENMTRGSGWRFLDLGRRLERGSFATAVLDELLEGVTKGEGALGLILDLCDSAITYRSRYLGGLQPAAVFDLVLADLANPRGVAFQLQAIEAHLGRLLASFAGQADPHAATRVHAALLQIGNTSLELLDDAAEQEAREQVRRLLGHLRETLFGLSEMITRAYFSHAQMPVAVGYEQRRRA